MPKAMIAEWWKVDELRLSQSLQDASKKLDQVEGEVVLDFSLVRRIDSSALRELETMADRADDKTIKIGLRGVNIDVYKVLKLMKLAPRFFFLT